MALEGDLPPHPTLITPLTGYLLLFWKGRSLS